MNRIIWIDIAKGITIILMIMGHSSLPKVCSDFIYAFHMPLFFVSSGMTSEFNSLSFSSFIYKKSQGIVNSFFVVFCISIITRFIFKSYTHSTRNLGLDKNGMVRYSSVVCSCFILISHYFMVF